MDEWQEFSYAAPDGLMLAGRKYGWDNRDAVPVVCLAGLTRNASDFHELAVRLAQGPAPRRRVLCLDYRGRGNSAHDRDWHNYNVLTEASDVIAGIMAAGIERAAFIGTSRGGLVIFVLTAIRPGLLRAVILNDVGPRVEATGLVRIKNYLDNSREFRSMEEAGRALKEIGQHQFPGWDLQMWIRQAERILETRDGRLRRRYDPRLTRALSALNLDNPLPTMWPQFEALRNVPVMAIRGENSDLLAAETVVQMAARHPGMTVIDVPGQGHAPDLGTAGQPGQIAEFLASVDRQRQGARELSEPA